MAHIVLLGDSIFDSAALIDYIDFRREPVSELRRLAVN